MRVAYPVRLLLALPVLAWSGWFLWAAFKRWQFSVFCSMACPAFIDAETAPAHFRAMDWQTPLLLACLPLAALGAAVLLRALLHPLKKTRAA